MGDDIFSLPYSFNLFWSVWWLLQEQGLLKSIKKKQPHLSLRKLINITVNKCWKFFLLTNSVFLCRNSASYSLSHLEDISKDHFLKTEEWEVSDTSSSLDLLLQVQRLLVSRIFPLDGEGQVPTMGTEKGRQWKISIIYGISICLHDLAYLVAVNSWTCLYPRVL